MIVTTWNDFAERSSIQILRLSKAVNNLGIAAGVTAESVKNLNVELAKIKAKLRILRQSISRRRDADLC